MRSNHLNGRAHCVHCNYQAALGDEADSIFYPLSQKDMDDVRPNCTPNPSNPIPQQYSETANNANNIGDDDERLEGGYTLDRCLDGFGDCKKPRQCMQWTATGDPSDQCSSQTESEINDGDGDNNNNNNHHCFCMLLPPERDVNCSRSTQCLPGDRCVKAVKGDPSEQTTFCVSCGYFATAVNVISVDDGGVNCLEDRASTPDGGGADTSDTSTSSNSSSNESASTTAGNESESEGDDDTTENEVCVDARALAHLGDEELVYGGNHRKARVLCDEFGSCATEGHMVEFEGRAMMMRRYCREVVAKRVAGARREGGVGGGGCQRRVMSVNSMRMRRARLRVASQTEGLHFTVFAARYKSSIEEAMLSMLFRYL